MSSEEYPSLKTVTTHAFKITEFSSLITQRCTCNSLFLISFLLFFPLLKTVKFTEYTFYFIVFFLFLGFHCFVKTNLSSQNHMLGFFCLSQEFFFSFSY